MKSVQGKGACLNGSSCPERDKRPGSFGRGSGDNDAMTDLETRDHDTDDARM